MLFNHSNFEIYVYWEIPQVTNPCFLKVAGSEKPCYTLLNEPSYYFFLMLSYPFHEAAVTVQGQIFVGFDTGEWDQNFPHVCMKWLEIIFSFFSPIFSNANNHCFAVPEMNGCLIEITVVHPKASVLAVLAYYNKGNEGEMFMLHSILLASLFHKLFLKVVAQWIKLYNVWSKETTFSPCSFIFYLKCP